MRQVKKGRSAPRQTQFQIGLSAAAGQRINLRRSVGPIGATLGISMKRPAGVILTSMVLGLGAAFQLLMAVAAAFAWFAIRHLPAVPPPETHVYPPGATPPGMGFLTGVMIVQVALYLLLATWAMVTLVGLVRLRNWARYSVLAIGGCMSAIGLMTGAVMAILAVVAPSLPGMPPNAPPHLMQGVFVFEGIIFGLIAGVGVWWLVYFNLRATKAFFVPAAALGYSPEAGPAYAIDPNTFPTLPPPPVAFAPTAPGRFSRVPVPVTVIACLFLFSGVCCLSMTFLPFPGLFLGFLFTGFPVHLLYFSLAAVSGLIGYGLLRLDNRARLLCYAFMAFGALNFALLLTPWGQTQYALYNAQILGRMGAPALPGYDPSAFTHVIMLAAIPICLVLYGAQVWILQHYRAAFVNPPHDSAPAL